MTPERLAEIDAFAKNRWLHGFDPQTVRDLLDHITAQDRLIAELEAGRVVVPELTNDDEIEAFNGHRDPTEDEINALRNGYALAVSRIRAIPAARVLGEGEVKMEICERDCREDDEDALEVLRVCGYAQQAEMLEVAIKAHDLRAQAGNDGE